MAVPRVSAGLTTASIKAVTYAAVAEPAATLDLNLITSKIHLLYSEKDLLRSQSKGNREI